MNYFNVCRKAYGLPTNWLWVYVYVRFPIGFIISIVQLYNFFNNLDLLFYDTLGQFLIVLFSITDISMLVLMCWTYYEMSKLTARGYKLNIVYLWLYYLYYALTNGLSRTDIDYVTSFITGLIAGLIWLVPNLIYFRKRKSLFIKPENTQTNIADNQVIENGNNDSWGKESVFTTLEKLNALKEKGVLTEEEFMQKKQELLQRIN